MVDDEPWTERHKFCSWCGLSMVVFESVKASTRYDIETGEPYKEIERYYQCSKWSVGHDLTKLAPERRPIETAVRRG